mmetsp:Transcript_56470/g.148494  ORF Transcript_56470/g.148494 Transcript_56470/m.148494 type:complete len:272 (-) Transcript_56470:64-879(-)
MGAACTRDSQAPQVKWAREHVPVPVTLHIYNVGTSSQTALVNKLLKKFGTGAFHCGVEVYGTEWSYSDVTLAPGEMAKGTGIFCCRPRGCDGHSYCESQPMGSTNMTEGEVLRLLSLLKKEWPVYAYSTLRKNCCHFSNEFCQRLGVGSIPEWVVSLANSGAALANAGDTVCCRSMAGQVAGGILCCGPMHGGMAGMQEHAELVDVDVVDQLPVLQPRSDYYDDDQDGVSTYGGSEMPMSARYSEMPESARSAGSPRTSTGRTPDPLAHHR